MHPQKYHGANDPVQSRSRDQENIQLEQPITPEETNHDQENLTIATHNIRGITRITDQEILLEEIHSQDIDILGLSETKLTNNNQSFVF